MKSVKKLKSEPTLLTLIRTRSKGKKKFENTNERREKETIPGKWLRDGQRQWIYRFCRC